METQLFQLTERDAFLEAMSRVASTVSIVTTDGPAGRSGATVSSLVSVSADSARPTLLVCLHQSSGTAVKVIENGSFCVNVLRDDQAWISNIFAGRAGVSGADRFHSTDWTLGRNHAPRLTDALVALNCQIASSQIVGQHHVIFGEVEGSTIGEGATPLLYLNRGYATARTGLSAIDQVAA